jgi:sugar phosphate permease
MGWFLCAIPFSTALGAPLGGLVLKLEGWGLEGWQWLFILEAIPTMAMGVFIYFWLTDRPEKADWLPGPEKKWLIEKLRKESDTIESKHSMSVSKTLTNPRVLFLSLAYFAIIIGLYGLGFWLPTLIKSSLHVKDNFDVTLLTAAPYAVGAVAIVLAGILVDKIDRPALLTSAFMAAGGIALTATAFVTGSPWVGYAGMCVCAVAVMASLPGFWRLPTAFLTGAAAAAGIALIGAVGNTAGFFGPNLVGWVTDKLGEAKWGLVIIGIIMILGSLTVVGLGNSAASKKPQRQE